MWRNVCVALAAQVEGSCLRSTSSTSCTRQGRTQKRKGGTREGGGRREEQLLVLFA